MQPYPDAPFDAPPPEPTEPPQPAWPQPGHLQPHWTTVFWIGWLLIAGSFAAIWYSSRLLGLATWWLGPSTDPTLLLVNLLPFTVPIALSVSALLRHRWLPYWGLGGAAFIAVIAAFDITGVPGFAAIEFALAAAGLCISAACLAGMYRRVSGPAPAIAD